MSAHVTIYHDVLAAHYPAIYMRIMYSTTQMGVNYSKVKYGSENENENEKCLFSKLMGSKENRMHNFSVMKYGPDNLHTIGAMAAILMDSTA